MDLNDLGLYVVKVNGFELLKFGIFQNEKKKKPAASRSKIENVEL